MFEFKLPDLGEGVHEGQIVSVLVKEGDTIAEYQPMLEVETDKAAVEIPSPKAGTVVKLNAKQGQVVKVGEVLVVIDEAGGSAKPAAAPAAKAAAPAPAKPAPAAAAPAPRPAPAPAATPARVVPEAPARPAAVAVAPAARVGPVPAAPVVRKLARELGVDINVVPGSGPGGRILRDDVQSFAAGGMAPVARVDGAPGAPLTDFTIPTEALPDFSQYGPVRREPVSQIRKTIARQMTRAWLNVPRVTHGDIVDITELERNRKKLNEGLRPGQTKLTITAIILKAVAAGLKEFPAINASFDAQTNEMIFKDYIHIGCAVDTPRGLIVPVVRDVDKKSLPQVAKDLFEVSERVKTGKMDVNKDLRGATFTVTNVGALGGTMSTPMVNYPEVAILGMGKAALQPMVVEGQIVPRLMLPLFMSFDHRVIDGADAARFMREVMSSLENPLRLIAM